MFSLLHKSGWTDWNLDSNNWAWSNWSPVDQIYTEPNSFGAWSANMNWNWLLRVYNGIYDSICAFVHHTTACFDLLQMKSLFVINYSKQNLLHYIPFSWNLAEQAETWILTASDRNGPKFYTGQNSLFLFGRYEIDY